MATHPRPPADILARTMVQGLTRKLPPPKDTNQIPPPRPTHPPPRMERLKKPARNGTPRPIPGTASNPSPNPGDGVHRLVKPNGKPPLPKGTPPTHSRSTFKVPTRGGSILRPPGRTRTPTSPMPMVKQETKEETIVKAKTKIPPIAPKRITRNKSLLSATNEMQTLKLPEPASTTPKSTPKDRIMEKSKSTTAMMVKEPVKPDMAEMRYKVALEIYTTEKSYCAALRCIVSDYMHPLQLDSGSGLLKKSKRDIIFGNIQEITNLHLPLLYDLEQSLQSRKAEDMGSIFAKTTNYFSIYKHYCASYAESLLCLSECKEHSSKFAAFLDSCGGNLASLLIQPVQRIPRYRLLFAELLKYTPKEHLDYQPGTKALLQIEGIAMHVNESVREKENQEKLLQIEQSFTNKVPTIVDPRRKFIREGVLVKMCRKTSKMRYFFLFSDLLIYSSVNESSTNSKVTYSFHRAFNMSKVQVEDLEGKNGMENAFQLLSDQKSFAVFAESPESKKQWLEDLQYSINYGKSPSDIKAANTAPIWVPDKMVKKCMQCPSKFTAINRRHHCRKCGDLVCGACSGKKFKLPNIGKACRVCDICFDELNGVSSTPRKVEKEKEFSDEKKQNLAKNATMKFQTSTAVPSASSVFSGKTAQYQSLVVDDKEDKNEEKKEKEKEKESGGANKKTLDINSLPAPLSDVIKIPEPDDDPVNNFKPPPPMNERARASYPVRKPPALPHELPPSPPKRSNGK